MSKKSICLWVTTQLSENYDYLAPDGSEIRLLPEVGGAGLCHCTLPEGGVSKAVTHKTVDEIWYVLSGEGQVWRKRGSHDAVVAVHEETSLTISFSDHFQFRNSGTEPLCILIATIPRWPGPEESVEVEGKWES
jgi:mannose-6-phosphate isomerase-like protein (cupin superfamily)